ncbi:MAG: GNAT family N-acetyltransferase [Rhizobiaceae bacterium]|nr:GNAT family N-acetyltransferase [Rhizobiaceae bacterium]
MSRLVRPLAEVEIERLVRWADEEGWNPGIGDATAFRAADPSGFIGAFVDGEMVAGISAIRYGLSYGFVGLYISRPDIRGQGHGKAVWQAGLARLEGRVVGLDGVDAQRDNYRAKGFVDAYRTVRYGGRLARNVAVPSDKALILENPNSSLLSAVVKFDRRTFPEDREAFLECWLAPPNKLCVAFSGESLTGYGVMRACQAGWKVGGLSAVDEDTAVALFNSLASRVDQEVFIDVPLPRAGFAAFLTISGLAPGFETTRMYRGGMLALSPELVGVTSLELG